LLLGHAPLETTATFDPLSNFEDFEFRLRAKDIELKSMNDFASAYGKFDFNAGHGDVVIEATAKKAQVTGYIKPLLRDVDVFNWQQDVENKDKGLFRSIWEAIVGGSETVLKNQAKTSSPPRSNSAATYISKISARSKRFCRFYAMVSFRRSMPGMSGRNRMLAAARLSLDGIDRASRRPEIQRISANLNIWFQPFHTPAIIRQQGHRKNIDIEQWFQSRISVKIPAQIKNQLLLIYKGKCQTVVRQSLNR
jgi:hypothetical protein